MRKNSLITNNLREWFLSNKRELPWRNSKSAYRVWVSEIILQQTRVAQGLPYYERFISAFPDVIALASATEQEILKLWQGLGYYSRARNMHSAAKAVVEKHNGVFPDKYENIIKLKGVGEYTAAAISSIAFGFPYAAVDGNVYRVLSRLYDIPTPINIPAGKKEFASLANEILDKENPGQHNEAIMEFGATVCMPKKPLCVECPLQALCVAYKEGKVSELPMKIPLGKQKERFFKYICVHNNQGLLLSKRKEGDIWQGLYELPLREEGRESEWRFEEEPEEYLYNTRHQLTHQVLNISFYGVKNKNLQDSSNNYIFVPFQALDKYPMPKPVEIFIDRFLNKLEKS